MESRKFNLLIIEHSPFLRAIFQQTLAPEFRLTLANRNKEVEKQGDRKETIDFIITDLDEPQTNGLETIRRIRSNPQYRHVPLLVLSEKDDSNLRIQCLEIGADMYIPKPFNPFELRARVKAVLRRTQFNASQSNGAVLGSVAENGTSSSRLVINSSPALLTSNQLIASHFRFVEKLNTLRLSIIGHFRSRILASLNHSFARDTFESAGSCLD